MGKVAASMSQTWSPGAVDAAGGGGSATSTARQSKKVWRLVHHGDLICSCCMLWLMGATLLREGPNFFHSISGVRTATRVLMIKMLSVVISTELPDEESLDLQVVDSEVLAAVSVVICEARIS